MNCESVENRVRYLTLAATAAISAISVAGCGESKLSSSVRKVTIEPANIATIEAAKDIEVTRANYTQFLSSDPNITFSEVVVDYVSRRNYLRENDGLHRYGVNLLMLKHDTGTVTLIDSQDKLFTAVLSDDSNIEKKVPAFLFANFNNVVSANSPVTNVEPRVWQTTMVTQRTHGCFPTDSDGRVIMSENKIGLTLDFANLAIHYDSVENISNPIIGNDLFNKTVCID